jgi:hypothetical protein
VCKGPHVVHMKSRTFEIRGLPALLMLGVFAVVAVGIVALLLMVGAAVAVAGLVLSAGAALYYAVRRKLAASTQTHEWRVENSQPVQAGHEVREIEVEVLSGDKR